MGPTSRGNFLLMLNTVVILVLIFILFKLQDIDVALQHITLQMKYPQESETPNDKRFESRLESRYGAHPDVNKAPGLPRVERSQQDVHENQVEQESKKEPTKQEDHVEEAHGEAKGKLDNFLGGYKDQQRPTALPPLKSGQKTYISKLDGVNLVVMSLWGKNYKYTTGALRNAELIKYYFPGWKLRVYVELPSQSPVNELVPNDVMDKLANLGAELTFMNPSETRIAPMMWRFLVADDMSVERFIIRDSDSRLSARDAATVQAWVKSGKPLSCVRDHPSHSASALSGGMWGGNPATIRNLMRRPFKQLMYGFKSGYGEDMNYLNTVVWPRLKDNFYCSDSVSCDRYPSSHPFPIPRYGYEHVGQVFDDHDLARPVDLQIMRQSQENWRCNPAKPTSS